MFAKVENLIQISKLIAPIALAFALNAFGTLTVASILHLAGFGDFIALGAAVVFSACAWNKQFKSLNELIGD